MEARAIVFAFCFTLPTQGVLGSSLASAQSCRAPEAVPSVFAYRPVAGDVNVAIRILREWPGDAVAVAPSGAVPQADSVVVAIRDTLGSKAEIVLIEIMRGLDSLRGVESYRLKRAAAKVYARLGLPPSQLAALLRDSSLYDGAGLGTSSAAFVGLTELEAPKRSVSSARAFYVCRLAELVVRDSGPADLAAELQNAILRLKDEQDSGSAAASDVVESREVQLGSAWLRAHGYDVGR